MIKSKLRFFLFGLSVLIITAGFAAAGSLLDPNEQGFAGQTRAQNYDTLVNELYNGNAVHTIGDKLWVPWYSSSSSCTVNDLHKGNSCNSGQTIDMTHNCMVTDEFSQVGVLLAMGNNQARMNEFYNTLPAIKSNYGKLPAWRVYRNGNTIEACKSGINGNCDTASDADARVISALYTASENSLFTDQAKKQQYKQLANEMAADFVKYDLLHSCKPSSLGQGQICYWLAAGANAKLGGMGTNDFAYTGYYSDSIIAMLQACANTGNSTYCHIADQLTLNYLEASKYNGNTFTTPPGRSFKWTNLNGVPQASCTHTCSPVQWDYADASRAVGICQANYYGDLIGHQLPLLKDYCNKWGNKYMNNPNSAPIQYFPNGNQVNYQSGYFAQGLQALFQAGGHNKNLFESTIDNALTHYIPSTKTWDYTQCFGVYMQAFPVRALGFGIGRDLASFEVDSPPVNPPAGRNQSGNGTGQGTNPNGHTGSAPSSPNTDNENLPQKELAPISYYDATCTHNGQSCSLISDETSGECRTIKYSTSAGNIQLLTCNKPNNKVEVYRQVYPSGSFNACVHTGCVDQLKGFASFDALFISPQVPKNPASPTIQA